MPDLAVQAAGWWLRPTSTRGLAWPTAGSALRQPAHCLDAIDAPKAIPIMNGFVMSNNTAKEYRVVDSGVMNPVAADRS